MKNLQKNPGLIRFSLNGTKRLVYVWNNNWIDAKGAKENEKGLDDQIYTLKQSLTLSFDTYKKDEEGKKKLIKSLNLNDQEMFCLLQWLDSSCRTNLNSALKPKYEEAINRDARARDSIKNDEKEASKHDILEVFNKVQIGINNFKTGKTKDNQETIESATKETANKTINILEADTGESIVDSFDITEEEEQEAPEKAELELMKKEFSKLVDGVTPELIDSIFAELQKWESKKYLGYLQWIADGEMKAKLVKAVGMYQGEHSNEQIKEALHILDLAIESYFRLEFDKKAEELYEADFDSIFQSMKAEEMTEELKCLYWFVENGKYQDKIIALVWKTKEKPANAKIEKALQIFVKKAEENSVGDFDLDSDDDLEEGAIQGNLSVENGGVKVQTLVGEKPIDELELSNDGGESDSADETIVKNDEEEQEPSGEEDVVEAKDEKASEEPKEEKGFFAKAKVFLFGGKKETVVEKEEEQPLVVQKLESPEDLPDIQTKDESGVVVIEEEKEGESGEVVEDEIVELEEEAEGEDLDQEIKKEQKISLKDAFNDVANLLNSTEKAYDEIKDEKWINEQQLKDAQSRLEKSKKEAKDIFGDDISATVNNLNAEQTNNLKNFEKAQETQQETNKMRRFNLLLNNLEKAIRVAWELKKRYQAILADLRHLNTSLAKLDSARIQFVRQKLAIKKGTLAFFKDMYEITNKEKYRINIEKWEKAIADLQAESDAYDREIDDIRQKKEEITNKLV